MDQNTKLKYFCFFVVYRWISENVSKYVQDLPNLNTLQRDIMKDLIISYIIFGGIINKNNEFNTQSPDYVLPEIPVD